MMFRSVFSFCYHSQRSENRDFIALMPLDDNSAGEKSGKGKCGMINPGASLGDDEDLGSHIEDVFRWIHFQSTGNCNDDDDD